MICSDFLKFIMLHFAIKINKKQNPNLGKIHESTIELFNAYKTKLKTKIFRQEKIEIIEFSFESEKVTQFT